MGGLAFAQDADGNWGYKIGGADPVVPFKKADITLYDKYDSDSTSSKVYTFEESGTYIIESFWTINTRSDDVIELFRDVINLSGAWINHNLYYIKNAIPGTTSITIRSNNKVSKCWIYKIN